LSNNFDSLKTGPSGISIYPALFQISSSPVTFYPSITGEIIERGYFDGLEVEISDNGSSR
jgi:hypothetical protein